ncbi:hypothetical protein [Synechocystis sp. LKSZ1]|uniref:hypothetical protein n=1 Tax=Synechocystis sp. LKSZ1 TaxID=3144951 RepID=UPI00336BEC0B
MEISQVSRGKPFPCIEPLWPILSLKFCLQTQLQQALTSTYPTLNLAPQAIPLSPKITPFHVSYRCALAFKLASHCRQSPAQILTTLQPWLPQQCSFPNAVNLPLQLETTGSGWFTLTLAYGDLEPWRQAWMPQLAQQRQALPPKKGITAPTPWSAYQYTHARLCYWLTLLESQDWSLPDPSLRLSPWPASMQALLGQILALIDELADQGGLSHPRLDNLCALALAVIADYPLTYFQAEPNLQGAIMGLLNLAQYLLAYSLNRQGAYDVPTEL